MKCLICNKSCEQVLTINQHDIFECENCLIRFIHKPDVPSDHIDSVYNNGYFFDGGAGYPNYLLEKKILINRGIYYATKLKKLGITPGELLDVGAAAGFTIKGFEKYGWKGTGIEPNKTMADYAKNKLGINVVHGTIESLSSNKSYDHILFLQVLEHLVDPLNAIEAALNMLNPNGMILVETWNYRSILAKFLKSKWHQYSPPSVIYWFTPNGLNKMFEEVGLKMLATGKPSKWIGKQHALSLVRHNNDGNKIYDIAEKIIRFIPDGATLPYPPLDLFWSLYMR